MRIEILEVEKDNPIELENGKMKGYPISFICDAIKGNATLVPAQGAEDNVKAGAVLFVETSQKSIDNLRILQKDFGMKMVQTIVGGDYYITGKVDTVGKEGVIMVRVHGISFFFSVEKEFLKKVSKEDYVSFDLKGLILYDMNL